MKYKTIAADPPWRYDDRGIERVGTDRHYRMMTMSELLSMPVAELCENDAHLYLWATNSFLVEAHQLSRAWGFVSKTVITWGKVCKGERLKPRIGMGHYFRNDTEHILFCVRGSLKLLPGRARSTLVMSRNIGHSVKPEWFYAMCEQCSPGPRLELFARRKRAGWDAFGDEVESDVELPT